MKHGEELICSYFACRNAGIKFRYCSHCKVPVAKRNFRKRHKHGGDVADKGDDSGDDEVTKTGIPSQILAGRDEAADADGISSQSGESSEHHEETEKMTAVPSSRVVEEHVLAHEARLNLDINGHSKAPVDVSATKEKICAERQDRWISLLAKRPSTKDSDTMSGWLMDVLAVSDLETPLKPSDIAVQSSKSANGTKDPHAEEIKMEDEKSTSNGDDQKVASNDKIVDNIVKKKRPVEPANDDLDESNVGSNSEAYASGSFAAWKERKKQKKQSKGFSSDVSGDSM